MDLSIIIVSWNTHDKTRECLASVFANLGSLKAQVIVVDNHSLDGTPDMIKFEFPDVTLFENQVNLGYTKAINRAFKHCLGRHVLLLHADTAILGQVLQKSVDYLDKNPQVGAMGCRVLNTDKTVQPTCGPYPSISNLLLVNSGLARIPGLRAFDSYRPSSWPRSTPRDVDTITGCFLMARRSALAAVGPMDESFFSFGGQADWCKRLRDNGFATRFAPTGEVIHHGAAPASSNPTRDIPHIRSLVALHLKHTGPNKAMLVSILILMLNILRAIHWTAIAFIIASETFKRRAQHARAIVRDFDATWPRGANKKHLTV